jgi:hypothetical protein
MPTKVIEVREEYKLIAPKSSAVQYKAARDAFGSLYNIPGASPAPYMEYNYERQNRIDANISDDRRAHTFSGPDAEKAIQTWQLARSKVKAAEATWKKNKSPPLDEVEERINLSITIQNAIDKMEATGCEFMNMVLKEKEVGAYLFFKCPAGGAGSARTRTNKKSRRSRTRKN